MNPFRKGFSVGSKLFITFFVGIVVFVVLVGTLSYRISEGIITKQAENSFDQTIDKTADNVNMTLANIESASKKLAVDASFTQNAKQLIDLTDKSKRTQLLNAVNESFRSAKADSDKIASVTVLYDGGGFSSEGETITSDAFQADWVPTVMEAGGQPIWLAPPGNGEDFIKAKDDYTPEPMLMIARLLRNVKTGEDIGILAVEVKVESLQSSFDGIEGDVFIQDATGKYVYHSDASKLGQPTEYADLQEGAEEISTSSGQQLVASQGLEGTEWLLVGSIPLSLLTKDTVQIAQVTIYTAIAAAVFAALVGWGVVRIIARPITSIANLMERAASGDLTGRAPATRRKDEIGKLSSHFNEMMSNTGELIRETIDSAAAVFETAASVEQASRSTEASASRIAESTRDIAEGSASLSSDAESGVVLAEQIMVGVGRVIDSNADMESKAGQVRRVGEEGQEHLRSLSETTGQVEQANRAINLRMEALSEQTASVTGLLDQLNRLARQINILSLNAAIEANRVGAAGKGFQVIAQEMGGLAKESETHLGRVASWMQSMVSDITLTTDEMNKARPLFEQQFGAIKQAEQLFGDIGERMNQFTESLNDGSDKVRQMEAAQRTLQETIMNVGAVSEQSTASVQEVAAMTGEQAEISAKLVDHAKQLATLSERLKELLVRFRV
ncbi:methyl-accepting chemotaxis protein [Cohnella lubricantis]|nr:methyl-accepting chemotaxis protein [Cohnella lubricantis]